MNKEINVKIIGAGLAGCEAAYQLAKRGVKVKLYEIKTIKRNDIQKTNAFAELVCSNTLRSKSLKNAVGILKAEMEQMDSLIIKAAHFAQIPSDDALAVDRIKFSDFVTNFVRNHPNIEVIEQEVEAIDENEDLTIIATGPLTNDVMKAEIQRLIGRQKHYFMDASAPIITKESIDLSKVYFKSRHGQPGAYMCIPFDQVQFNEFFNQLINGETVKLKEFENEIFFNGCQPIEQLAKKGQRNLLNGPMSPNNLTTPIGEIPFAVVQLRQDDALDSLYNIVGFQTNLKWSEQKRIIATWPGFENCEIVRYGVMHKNYYINSPKVLNYKMQVTRKKNIFFAGQITGVEGYVESAASGLWTGLNVYAYLNNIKLERLPKTTMLGALINYISNDKLKKINPMKANLGLVEKLTNEKEYDYYQQSLEAIIQFLTNKKLF